MSEVRALARYTLTVLQTAETEALIWESLARNQPMDVAESSNLARQLLASRGEETLDSRRVRDAMAVSEIMFQEAYQDESAYTAFQGMQRAFEAVAGTEPPEKKRRSNTATCASLPWPLMSAARTQPGFPQETATGARLPSRDPSAEFLMH